MRTPWGERGVQPRALFGTAAENHSRIEGGWIGCPANHSGGDTRGSISQTMRLAALIQVNPGAGQPCIALELRVPWTRTSPRRPPSAIATTEVSLLLSIASSLSSYCESAPNRDPLRKHRKALIFLREFVRGGVPIGADWDPEECHSYHLYQGLDLGTGGVPLARRFTLWEGFRPIAAFRGHARPAIAAGRIFQHSL